MVFWTKISSLDTGLTTFLAPHPSDFSLSSLSEKTLCSLGLPGSRAENQLQLLSTLHTMYPVGVRSLVEELADLAASPVTGYVTLGMSFKISTS